MDKNQIGQIYDSFPENQRNIPKTEFIKRAMNTMNPVRCKKILNIMVEKKHQAQVQKTVIDSAITRKGDN